MTTEKKPNPTAKEWAQAEALWALGETTRDEIAKKLDVSPTAVTLHMRKVGVERGSKADEHRKKVAEHVADAATIDSAVYAQRIKETKDEHYMMSKTLARMTWEEVANCKKTGNPLSVASSNLKAIESAINILSKARQERWAILGLDRPDAVDTNELPALVIEELTANQIEDLRNRDFNSFEEEAAGEVVQETQPTA